MTDEKRRYTIQPDSRMIDNPITEVELQDLKRLLQYDRSWKVIQTIFRNAATCAMCAGQHETAMVYEQVASFDVGQLEMLIDHQSLNAPFIVGEGYRDVPMIDSTVRGTHSVDSSVSRS
jgi:hypothetical protein